MMKTSYYRMRNKKDFEGCYDLCREGAIAQLSAGEVKGGQEMAKLLGEAYAADKVPAGEAAVARALDIMAAFPRGALAGVTLQSLLEDELLPSPLSEFMITGTAFAKWCRGSGGEGELTSRILSEQAEWVIGELGWKGAGIASAALVQARRGARLGEYLALCAQSGGEAERDLFAARGVLQMLGSGKKADGPALAAECRALLAAFRAAGTAAFGADPLATPLGRFAELLVEAVERQRPELGKMLLQAYHNSLIRDPNLRQMAQGVVNTVLLGQEPKGPGGLMGEIMKMFG